MVYVIGEQFGFMPGLGTTGEIYVLRLPAEKYRKSVTVLYHYQDYYHYIFNMHWRNGLRNRRRHCCHH